MKNEKRLHFTDVGEGKVAFVFLHYFGGSSHTWQKVIVELSPQFRCIAIDLPGFGDSQGEFTVLSVNFCADRVISVIEMLQLEKYVLVGHSMGGKIALAVASRQLPGLLSLILIAPSPPTPEPMDDKARAALIKAFGDRSALEKLANSITAKPLPKQDIEDVVADNLRVSKVSWTWWAELGSREDISSQMSGIQFPVFIISGEKDPNFSTAFLHKEMSDYFPSASFAEVTDTGHLLPVEKPFAVAKLIREFAGKQKPM